MAINFPNTPTAGNTYTYLGVTYTWKAAGYWAVDGAGDIGPATGAETDAGTENGKYMTPQSIEDSTYIKMSQLTQAINDAVNPIMSSVFPIGSIYTNADVNTNPATLLGIGVWARFGEGRVLQSEGPGFAIGQVAGETTHTLTTAQLPSHTHSFRGSGASSGLGRTHISIDTGGGISHAYGATNVDATGSGAAHNIMQPYIVVYMWRRTA